MKFNELDKLLSEAKYKELFHVTHTKHVKKLKKEGIKPLQTSNWIQGDGGDRYGGGYIFVFERVEDALRWASKMDWDMNGDFGTGKVSIVKLKPDGYDWEVDIADPISQAMSKGKWLKRMRMVEPKYVIKDTKFKSEMAKLLTDYEANIKPSKVGL